MTFKIGANSIVAEFLVSQMLQRRWIANLISSPQLCAVRNKQTPSYYQLTLHTMMAGSSVRTSSSKQHFFIARHTNCACFLWSPKGMLANEGNYAKEHITIAELYLFVFFSISRGESFFSCGRKFTSPWLYCWETGNSEQWNCFLLCSDQKSCKSLFSGAPIEELHFIFFNFK